MAAVSLRSVSYTYPHRPRPALRDVDFELTAGETTVLAGLSGSGKSTLAWTVNGLAAHFFGGRLDGAAEVCGLSVAQHPVWRLSRHVGSVFQNAASQLFASTPEEEAALGLEYQGLPRRRIAERVEWALDCVGMAEHRNAPLDQLSAGQQQRVAIAAALALGGDVLLLDEPTANLDREASDALCAALRQVKAESGAAVLLIEHRAFRAAPFADRLAVLREGALRTCGRPDELGAREELESWGVRVEPPGPLSDSVLAAGDPGGPAALEAEGLRFAYRNGFAVEADWCCIRHGECVALVGPNGAGKTTLIKLLAGLLRPARGRVAAARSEASARAVGLVLQNADHQLFTRTVFDEVALSLRLAGEKPSRVRQRVQRILEAMGLLDLAHRHPHSLSGGEKQRVAIAAAAIARPRLLILDEPTSGMDARRLDGLAALLDELRRDSLALLLATHDMELVNRLADRVWFMERGRLLDAAPDWARRL